LRVTLCFVGSGEGNPLAADDEVEDIIQQTTVAFPAAVSPSKRTVVASEYRTFKVCNSLVSRSVKEVDAAAFYKDKAFK